MPFKPARPCAYGGCPNLTNHPSRLCDEHLRKTRQIADHERGTSTERGYDARWRRYRKAYLAEHPLCALCAKKGITRAATTVDHIIPHRGNYELFWDPKNHQPLCEEHHNIKTATFDHGFGNERKG